ncbi:MAG: OadG family protein [Vallitalea sp.]|jgi:sodium pump decarboxylase gamma subunit|nr:OadG family protein [Vallitalea sp.]
MSKLSEGLIALISGMGIVFIVLILIAFIIWLFKFIDQPKKKEVVVPESVPTQVTIEEDETDDLELVAVISAAIAASLNTTTDKLQVKSFRKIGSTRSKW